jgi:ABC-type Na+ transport system ATPase subunit NatA
MLESKRDRGASIVVSSHRIDDVAGLCDAYLLLLPQQAVLIYAHELAPVGTVTPSILAHAFDRLRNARPRRMLELAAPGTQRDEVR